MPEVSVIILNYNTFQLTCNCIASVIEFTKDISYEIILVDNQSTECDADLFKDKFPFIKLIKSPENGGFAKGNNLGIGFATGELILLLNSDTYLSEDAISKQFITIRGTAWEVLLVVKWFIQMEQFNILHENLEVLVGSC